MDHKERLTTMARLVTERGAEYGDMVETHKRIARLFNDMCPDVKIEAHHVAQVLLATKLARLYANPTHSDSVTDAGNYIVFYGELVGNGAPGQLGLKLPTPPLRGASAADGLRRAAERINRAVEGLDPVDLAAGE